MTAFCVVLIGLGCLILGMACPFIAFLAFKPVLSAYVNAVTARMRAAEGAARTVLQPVPEQKRTKAPSKGVTRPVRDIEEEIST
jgi:hypothetical protein